MNYKNIYLKVRLQGKISAHYPPILNFSVTIRVRFTFRVIVKDLVRFGKVFRDIAFCIYQYVWGGGGGGVTGGNYFG